MTETNPTPANIPRMVRHSYERGRKVVELRHLVTEINELISDQYVDKNGDVRIVVPSGLVARIRRAAK